MENVTEPSVLSIAIGLIAVVSIPSLIFWGLTGSSSVGIFVALGLIYEIYRKFE
jgi:uncharacterized membrane protein